MAYTAEELELYNWLKSSIPRWFFQKENAVEELWGAVVETHGRVKDQIDDWLDAVYILTASDLWLDEHARDRGTFRQFGEVDAVLADRLRTIEEAVSLAAIKTAVNSILAAQGLSTTCAIVELRRDRAYFLTRISPTGTGDQFILSGTTVTLLDLGYTFSGHEVGRSITIAGATSGANNGTFVITDVTSNNMITYTNAAGVAESYTGTWTIDSGTNGRKDAYLSRGYRMTQSERPSTFIVICPTGTWPSTRLAIYEAVRRKKGAGYKHIVEARSGIVASNGTFTITGTAANLVKTP